MKRFLLGGVSIFTLAALFSISFVSANQPDEKKTDDGKPKAGITASLGKVQLDAQHIRVHKRTAIAHKPLEMVDKAGKKISADTLIELSNGKKVKAGPHYAELNKLEKKLNDMGHSVRNKGATVVQQTIVNEKELDDHSKKVHVAHLTFDAKTMKPALKVADLEKLHTSKAGLDLTRIKQASDAVAAAPANAPAATASLVKQWNYTLGNKSIVAAFLNGKVEIKGNKDDVTVSGDAKAGGYLVGKEIALIKATGSAFSPAKGQSKANLHVYLLGQHVVNVAKSGDAAFTLKDTKSHGIDVHASMHFAIGPVPITAKLGAKGKAGVSYLVAVRPAHATMQVTAFVDARVYAQVAVDIGIASGGAKGEVILLKDDLTFGAELGLDYDPIRGPKLTEHVYAQNKMTMLAGSVSAFVRVHVPFFDDPEYHHTIFSWKGLQTSGYLFNVNNTQYLIPNFQAAAATTGTATKN